jgi:hypothetical protein
MSVIASRFSLTIYSMLISKFLLLSLGRYLCWYTISPTKSIICPIVRVSVLTWFIGYIYYCNLQFLNNVIIIKSKLNLVDFGYAVFPPKNLLNIIWKNNLSASSVPETCRAHEIRYLRLYYYHNRVYPDCQ